MSKSPTTIKGRGPKAPLDPVPPGEILLEEFMKPMTLSINALARDIDVPPSRISEIIKGKRAITADTALRLGKYFGVSPEIWLDLQTDYDLRAMRRRAWPKIEPRIRVRLAEPVPVGSPGAPAQKAD